MAGKFSMAVDAFVDTLTGRGSGGDRAGRPQGATSRKSEQSLLSIYKSNGAMQRVVNAPADDATRKGFKIVTDDPRDDADLQKRWTELDLQVKFRDLIKFSQIYSQGSALFIGLLSNTLEEQRRFALPMTDSILEVDFVNSLNHPGDFVVQSVPVFDPTMREFGEVFFRVAGQAVHSSWMLWLVSEWDKEDNKGISRVESTFDAVVAQDSALWSVSTMVQQLSMIIYESNKFIKKGPTKKAEFSNRIRNFVQTNSFWGIKEGEKVSRLDYNIQGLKEILDFIFQNISLYSQIPQNILIGRAQGILTAAEEDTINYYSLIANFQKSKLERLYRRMIDILLLEKRSPLFARHNGKLEYEVEFFPLWELAPSLKSDIELKNAERDNLDIMNGKITAAEARLLDDRVNHLEDDAPEPEETNQQAASGGEPVAPARQEGDAVGVSQASSGKVSKFKDHLRVQFHEHEEIDFMTWEQVALDADAGIFGTKTKLLKDGPLVFFDINFHGDMWTEEKALTWIDFKLPGLLNSVAEDGNVVSLDEIENAVKRTLGEWDQLPTIELSEKPLVNEVIVNTSDGEHKMATVNKKEGIFMVVGKDEDKQLAVKRFRFDTRKRDMDAAKKWVVDHGFETV